MDFLKKNAVSFLKNAKELFEKGEYNLSAFNVEQAVQLILKYLIAKNFGDFPENFGDLFYENFKDLIRTHSIKFLLKKAWEICPDLKDIFTKEANVIGNIENAYITSRYYPVEFTREEIEKMLDVADEIFDVIERCVE